MQVYANVLEMIGRAAGLSAATARRRAEGAVVRIEGALVVAAGMGDTSVFGRTIDDLRATLLVPEPRRKRRSNGRSSRSANSPQRCSFHRAPSAGT